ncbi:sulfite exporter TauE/SafE family protein [Minwuia sp.]|uniref:sulfite exporter TauE/SafE family protein n=1 Tax=Minwuia sp. TaxID=2493630 RepID=UPI003A94BB93
MEFMPELDTLFWIMLAMSAGAGLMRGFAGFGSAMMLSPLLSLYYSPLAAVLIIGIMEIVVSIQLVPKALKDVEWPFLRPVIIAAILCIPLGIWALSAIDGNIISAFISLMVLAFVIVLATGWRYAGPKRLPITIGIGGLSGALIASTSVGGPPLLIYMMAGSQTARQVRANIIVYFAVIEIAVLIALWVRGLFDMEYFLMGAFFCPTYLAGAWLGSRLFRESSEHLYRRIALILLAIIAVYGLAGSLR